MEKSNEKEEISAVSIPSKSTAESSKELGSRSDVSSSVEQASFGKGFAWKSRYQHAMYFVAYTFSWGMFSYRRGRGIEDSENMPTWFHVILTYIIFAGPLLYLQVFVGQYTQKGCIVLGAMLPLSYGIGYCMLLNTLLSCSLNLYFCSAILYYILVAMINYPTPSWMICLPEYRAVMKRCFSRDDIDLCVSCLVEESKSRPPCYDPVDDVLSATLFQESVIFGNDPISGAFVSAKPIQIANLIITTIIVSLLSVRTLRDLDDSIRIWNLFTSVSIIITSVVILLNNPRLEFLVSMFYFNVESVFKIKCWTQAFSTTALKINIAESGHMLFGSYMPLTVNCPGRLAYVIIMHLLYLFLCNIFAFMTEDFLACSLNMNIEGLNPFSDLEATFGLYPMALGILAAAQVWATIYFLILFFMSLHSVVLQIIIVQETLSQEIIGPTYWIYTRILLVVIISGAAILYASLGGSALVYELFLHRNVIHFSLICVIYVILFLYGIDRIGDDIHFLLHSPPSRYLKISWAISAAVCFFIFTKYFVEETYLRNPKVTAAITAIIFLPLPVGLLYQLVGAVRARDMSALVKPSRGFGPADSEERANRRLFNPRFEVRFRRTRNFCKHRCLLGSVTLRRCLEKELTLLNHVLVELGENEEEREIKKDFLQALKKHREIMTNALHFDPTKEYFRNRKTDNVQK